METQLTEQENTRALEMLPHIEANPDISQKVMVVGNILDKFLSNPKRQLNGVL